MAISSAVQKGSQIVAYNEKGLQLFMKAGTLSGFTSTTVTVIRNKQAITFNEKGLQMFSKPTS